MNLIFEELSLLWSSVDQKELENIVKEINSCNGSIFCLGAGRMGYAIQAFSMRLSHLGYSSYMIGDTTLPRIKEGDLVIINSSTGETPSIVLLAQIAKQYGGRLVVISSNKKSTLSSFADMHINYEKIQSNQLMKTVYEQFSFLLLDKIAFDVFELSGRELDFVENNHSVLE
jgi:6-phospho-3-hexuloisomerase